MSRTAPYDGRSRDVLRLYVKESRPGGPWSGEILVCISLFQGLWNILRCLLLHWFDSNVNELCQEIQVDPMTVVWELKQQLYERRHGYAPANSRLEYHLQFTLHVNMATCSRLRCFRVGMRTCTVVRSK